MVKALIVALAVALLLWLLFGRGRRSSGDEASRRSEQGQVESMVTCAQCGVHLPRTDALAARGLHYCSAEHRDGPPAP